MSDDAQVRMQAAAIQKLIHENVSLRATISRMRDDGLRDEEPAPRLPPPASLPTPIVSRLPDRLPERPRGRILWIVTAGSILSIALERLIFWADVAAIGAALLGLFGWISPIPLIPKASHEIARVVETPVPQAPPISQIQPPISLTGVGAGGSGGSATGGVCGVGQTLVATAMSTGGGAGMPVLTCSSSSSIGSSANGTIIVTYGGGGGGGNP